MPLASTYDKCPFVPISSSSSECAVGWQKVLERLGDARPRLLCVECYPGVFVEDVERAMVHALQPVRVFRSSESMKSASEIEHMLSCELTDDPVFGRMGGIGFEDFMDPAKLARARSEIQLTAGLALVIGTGASLLAPQADILVHADLTRWEIQQRQRRNEIANLGADNQDERASLKYEHVFFVDWRAADCLKIRVFPKIDYLLDTNNRPTFPAALRSSLWTQNHMSISRSETGANQKH